MVGKAGKNEHGQFLRDGFFSEHDVREAVSDLLEQVNLDRAYFQPEAVKFDLSAFANRLVRKIDEHGSAIALNTKNIRKLQIHCSTGQAVDGSRYLSLASIAFGLAKNFREAQNVRFQTLAKLFEIADISSRNSKYYLDPDCVGSDLQSFAAAVTEARGKTTSAMNLTPSNIRKIRIICSNGVRLSGLQYLNDAAICHSSENDKIAQDPRKVLESLLRLAGVISRDVEYYRNSDYVAEDLKSLAKKTSKSEKELMDPVLLSTYKIVKVGSFACSNGEVVSGRSYLRTAGQVLGFGKSAHEVDQKYAHILSALFSIAGFEKKNFDSDHFNDSTLVKSDLENFALSFNEKGGRILSPSNLSTYSMGSSKIKFPSGETITGETYLNRAVVAFGLSDKHGKAKPFHADVLRKLKKIAGFLTESDE